MDRRRWIDAGWIHAGPRAPAGAGFAGDSRSPRRRRLVGLARRPDRGRLPGARDAPPPADRDEVGDAQIYARIRFPDELRVLYSLADGQFPGFPRGPGPHPPSTNLFPTCDLLPVSDALVHWGGWRALHTEYGPSGVADFDRHITVRGDDPVRREYWNLGWWPLAVDGGGNFLAVDTDPAPGGTVGQVIVAGPDEDERRVLGAGIADYLRRLASSEIPPPEPSGEDDPADPVAAVLWWDIDELR